MVFASAIGVAVLGMLSGCGGGDSTPVTAQSDPAAYFNTVLKPGYDSLNATLTGYGTSPATTGMANTAGLNLQKSGTANFTGFAALSVNAAGAVATSPSLGMEGTATMAANFSTETVTGSLTNFVGTSVTPAPASSTAPLVFTKAPVNYAGTLTLTGCIGTTNCTGPTGVTTFATNLTGTLTGENNTIVMNSTGAGQFKGTVASTGAPKGAVIDGVRSIDTVNGVQVQDSLRGTSKNCPDVAAAV